MITEDFKSWYFSIFWKYTDNLTVLKYLFGC